MIKTSVQLTRKQAIKWWGVSNKHESDMTNIELKGLKYINKVFDKLENSHGTAEIHS